MSSRAKSCRTRVRCAPSSRRRSQHGSFPVGEDVRQIVVDWVKYLATEQLFGPVDPLFPATAIVQDQYHLFQRGGLSRAHWSNATPIRTIFKEAFTSAGLAYANPHSFRKTLAQLGERLCRTPEEFKAWSQNLGHEQVLTTFSSYGQVGADRQAELIRRLGQKRGDRCPQGGAHRPHDPNLAGGQAHPGMKSARRREAQPLLSLACHTCPFPHS